LIKLGKEGDALQAYERAIKREPGLRERYEHDLRALVEGSSAGGREEGARRASSPGAAGGQRTPELVALESAVQAQPASAKLRHELSIHYMRAGRLAEALEQAREAERLRGPRGAA
jgi:cytochrome c-type biogenesis protein CcmH/NrfG